MIANPSYKGSTSPMHKRVKSIEKLIRSASTGGMRYSRVQLALTATLGILLVFLLHVCFNRSVHIEQVPLRETKQPIFVVGMPKSGTTSVATYFRCRGLDVSHWNCNHGLGFFDRVKGKLFKCGDCIRENLEASRPATEGCGDYQVYAQMDHVWVKENDFRNPGCYFPQVEALNEIHEQYPNATFILNLRPPMNWINSINFWTHYSGFNFRDLLTECNITGLPKGVGTKDEELVDFYDGHSRNVREFVAAHPSHKLVEVEIESPTAPFVMDFAFGSSHTSQCWRNNRACASAGKRCK